MNTPFDTLIWDWNGTLMDDADHCVAVLNAMCARRGIPSVSAEHYRARFNFPVIHFYRELGFDLDGEAYHVVSQEFIEGYCAGCEFCPIHPFASEFLQAAADAGWRQIILSACRQDILESLLRGYGVDRFFSRVYGQDGVLAESKESVGRVLMAELKLNPERTLMIGDTTHDHEVAQAMGIRCALLSHGHHATGRLQDCRVPVFSDLPSLALGLGLALPRDASPHRQLNLTRLGAGTGSSPWQGRAD